MTDDQYNELKRLSETILGRVSHCPANGAHEVFDREFGRSTSVQDQAEQLAADAARLLRQRDRARTGLDEICKIVAARWGTWTDVETIREKAGED
jgi:hypothetical protein